MIHGALSCKGRVFPASYAKRSKAHPCMQEQQTFHGALQSLLTDGYEADSCGPCVHRIRNQLCFRLQHCQALSWQFRTLDSNRWCHLCSQCCLHLRRSLKKRAGLAQISRCTWALRGCTIVMRLPSPASQALRHLSSVAPEFQTSEHAQATQVVIMILARMHSSDDGAHGS